MYWPQLDYRPTFGRRQQIRSSVMNYVFVRLLDESRTVPASSIARY